MNNLNGISIVWALALASAPFTPQKQDIASARIVPKQMQAEFSRAASKKVWTDYIYSPTNKKLYVFSLEPQLDVGNHIIGIDLLLRDAERPKSDENLLNPPRPWHGLQPYSFMASDLLHGAGGSAFGAHRTIRVRGRGLDVGIQILVARISALPDGAYQIDELKLSVTADNMTK
jgi:hypothetical protein